MEHIKSYINFVNEEVERYAKGEGKFIDSDYTPYWKDEPQRYLNKKQSAKLAVLYYLFLSGDEGRTYKELQKFYYGFNREGGKRLRAEYTRDFDNNKWDVVPGTDKPREYDSVKDRGIGGTVFSGGDWHGKPTGILRAHCDKTEDGKWILTDKKLIRTFSKMSVDDVLQEVGLEDL